MNYYYRKHAYEIYEIRRMTQSILNYLTSQIDHPFKKQATIILCINQSNYHE